MLFCSLLPIYLLRPTSEPTLDDYTVHVHFMFQEYISDIIKDTKKSTFCKQRTLCHSIAGNSVPLLTITSPSGSPGEVQVVCLVQYMVTLYP